MAGGPPRLISCGLVLARATRAHLLRGSFWRARATKTLTCGCVAHGAVTVQYGTVLSGRPVSPRPSAGPQEIPPRAENPDFPSTPEKENRHAPPACILSSPPPPPTLRRSRRTDPSIRRSAVPSASKVSAGARCVRRRRACPIRRRRRRADQAGEHPPFYRCWGRPGAGGRLKIGAGDNLRVVRLHGCPPSATAAARERSRACGRTAEVARRSREAPRGDASTRISI